MMARILGFGGGAWPGFPLDPPVVSRDAGTEGGSGGNLPPQL